MGGNLCNRPPRALDNRAAFLNGSRPSYVLYYWEVADTHQLLASSLQRLSNHAGAASALSPPVVLSLRRSSLTSSGGSSRGVRRHPERQDDNVMAPFVNSVRSKSCLLIVQEIGNMRGKKTVANVVSIVVLSRWMKLDGIVVRAQN